MTRPKLYLSIRWKILITIIVIMTVSNVILTIFFTRSQRNLLNNELDKRIELYKQSLISKGQNYVANQGLQIENGISAFNWSGVVEMSEESVENNKDIAYAILQDQDGLVAVHTAKPGLLQTVLTDERSKHVTTIDHGDVYEFEENNSPFIEIAKPIRIGDHKWGFFRTIF